MRFKVVTHILRSLEQLATQLTRNFNLSGLFLLLQLFLTRLHFYQWHRLASMLLRELLYDHIATLIAFDLFHGLVQKVSCLGCQLVGLLDL